MKLTRIFLAALMLLPLAAHADGLLQMGDTSHPIAVQDQTSSGTLVNGDTLVMHILYNGTGTSRTGTGTFSQPDTTNQPGIYYYTPSAADAAAESYGDMLCQASDSTTPANVINPTRVEIVAFNPFAASNLGLTALPAVAPATTGGLVLVGTGAGDLNPDGTGKVYLSASDTQAQTEETAALNGLGYSSTLATNLGTTNTRVSTALPNAAPNASGGLLTYGSSTGQLNPSGGTFTGVGLAATQTGVTIPTVTTVGSVTGSVGSVTGNVGGSVANVTGAVGSVTGNVGGNVTGSVGSVTGTVTANTTQWGGTAVTGMPLPTASYTAPPSAATVATATAAGILSNPSYPLLTNSSGYVTSTNGGGGGGSVTDSSVQNDVYNELNLAIPGSPTAGSIFADEAANTTAIAALPASIAAASLITIPGTHTSSGSSLTLTNKQAQALALSIQLGDMAQTALTPSSTATVTYYLPGATHSSSTITDVATVTTNSSGAVISRTDVVTAPFPTF